MQRVVLQAAELQPQMCRPGIERRLVARAEPEPQIDAAPIDEAARRALHRRGRGDLQRHWRRRRGSRGRDDDAGELHRGGKRRLMTTTLFSSPLTRVLKRLFVSRNSVASTLLLSEVRVSDWNAVKVSVSVLRATCV